ncbi:MAG: twin-arginine translocation signal domain-containing protein [Pyrinomonadaceae bacterium]
MKNDSKYNLKIERREFLELGGLAVAGAAVFNGPRVRAQRPLPKTAVSGKSYGRNRA